ncbi:ABC transporter permease [Clostridium hydrogenum]|uniref:ABC transporter permease n=1 Tax=Clostridium hydrogenum TaxID=2855764 RepID=UPI001F2A3FBD|nr:ABC transporter permease [Clostridium hydrogenum]
MTFSEIVFKMFKADAKKYKLFILCNLFSIAILYSFISIALNGQFMNSSIVDPMISHNIYAPTFLVIVFMAIFIPYAQSVFMKTRQKDYGILLTLGMTENEVTKSVIIENFIMCTLSLIMGLVAGTFLSLFFLGFARKVIGIYNIDINISLKAYELTAVYVLALFAISVIINIFGMAKSTILDKIKYAKKAESAKHYSLVFSCIGLILTISAFVLLFFCKNIGLISFIFCNLGSFLIFFNGEAILERFKNKHYKSYMKNVFLFSDTKYYYGKNKKIFLVNTWLFFCILFFVVLSSVQYPSMLKYSSTYHPFNMVYGDIKGDFKPLENKEIQAIVHKNSNSITANYTVSFVRNNTFTIFCVDDVNKTLKKNYKVQENSFIYVHPYDINDGYAHEDINSNIPNFNINSKQGERKFMRQKVIVNPLFGQVNCISQNIILVNKKDYEWIRKNNIDFYVGTLHLYNFSDWHNSNGIVNEVWNKLVERNNIKSGDDFYKTSSRIEAYNTALRSSNFLTFLLIYVDLLLYFSAIIMLHYKLRMEYEEEKGKYFGLYKIGIEEVDIKKMISQKILVLYGISLIYAIIINFGFSFYFFGSHGWYGIQSILATFVASTVLLGAHLGVGRMYSNAYYTGILEHNF